MTALHLAATIGDVEVAKILLAWNPNIFARDNDMKTPLHYAAEHGHGHVVALLWKSSPIIVEHVLAQIRMARLQCTMLPGMATWK